MKQLLYDPQRQGNRMTIVCFISGSGTNFQRIVERDGNHNYIVFTNRPGCEGSLKAIANGHSVIELSHVPYFKGARERYGGSIPRNCPEREKFEQDAWRLIEERGKPDVICLAGYDLVFTDWSVDRYPSRILNVHPGDTTKGYAGLHWIPTAMAILAGESEIRSTLLIVDNGMDTGPVLVQSRPLNIFSALAATETRELGAVIEYAGRHFFATYEKFAQSADDRHKDTMKQLCEKMQKVLKEKGDWEIYPFGVHDLIGKGRVSIDGRKLYVDGKELPAYGYRMDAPL